MKAWLIAGLLGLALIQPIQEGQAAQSAENRQQIEKQKSPPKTQSSQPTEPNVPPPDSQKARNDSQPLPEKKANYWKEAFGPPTLGNWVLVLVGIGATIAALLTLRVIQQQVNIMVDSERAWILAEVGVAEPPQSDMHVMWVAPSVTNYGKTPGRILKISIRSQCVPNPPGTLPLEPQYSKEKDFNFVLPPSKVIRPVKVMFPGREMQDVVERKAALYIYGFIDYLDLGEKQRKTRFCFTYYVPPVAGDLGEPGFYVAAEIPAIYNDCT